MLNIQKLELNIDTVITIGLLVQMLVIASYSYCKLFIGIDKIYHNNLAFLCTKCLFLLGAPKISFPPKIISDLGKQL